MMDLKSYDREHFNALMAAGHSREHFKLSGAGIEAWYRPRGMSSGAGPLGPFVEVTFEQLNQPVSAAAPAAWNGPEDGLPPVGLTVEVFDDREPHFSYAMHIGQRVRIVAHDVLGEGDDEGTPVAVYAFNHPKGEGYHALVAGKFRPICTPEQLAAEERERTIDDMVKVTCINRGEAGRIYDAGYRKVEQL